MRKGHPARKPPLNISRLKPLARPNDSPSPQPPFLSFAALWLCGFVALWLCGFVRDLVFSQWGRAHTKPERHEAISGALRWVPSGNRGCSQARFPENRIPIRFPDRAAASERPTVRPNRIAGHLDLKRASKVSRRVRQYGLCSRPDEEESKRERKREKKRRNF